MKRVCITPNTSKEGNQGMRERAFSFSVGRSWMPLSNGQLTRQRATFPRLLALKPFACLSLFCLSLIVFLLTPPAKPSFHSRDNFIHTHHHQHHLQQQQIIERRISSNAPATICRGRRIYIYKLPPRFNSELLRQCSYGITSWLNFCAHIAHHGLGEPLHTQELTLTHDQVSTTSPSANDSFLESLDKKAPNTIRRMLLAYYSSIGEAHHTAEFSPGPRSEWHRTDAYMLEVIFHFRLLHYPCLTDDPDMADAFFLPYYAGLDALNYLYGKHKSKPKSPRHGSNLVSWLQQDAIAKEAWKKYRGQDHFLVLGRTPWDFVNLGSAQWGTGLLQIPEYSNMTLLLIERQPWMPNQHAIPYPTSFHPSSSSSLHAWMERVRNKERPALFAFVGSIRPTLMKGGIRDMLVDQCLSSRDCKLLDCKELKCSHNPEPIMRIFLHSQFCLQPRGDTPTRRSLFDAIIAGCIPVLFHNDTAYTQYGWHLPKEAKKWSVYIDEEEIRKGELVEETLLKYTEESMIQMREVLIGMIPKVVYAGYSLLKQGEADAFDVSVRETLKLVSHKKRKLANYERGVF